MNEEALIQLYREMDRDCALLSHALHGEKKDGKYKYLIPDEEKKAAFEARHAELLKNVEELEAPSLKFTALREHMKDFLANLKLEIDGLLDSPAGVFGGIIWGYEDIFRKSRKPADERVDVVTGMLNQSEDIWNGIQGWVGSCSQSAIRSSVRMFTGMADGLADYLQKADTLIPDACEAKRDELKACLEHTKELYERFAKELEESLVKDGKTAAVIPDTEKTVKMPEEEYRAALRYRYGVDLDEILSWGDSEVNKTRNECFAIAEKLAKQYGEPVPTTMVELNNMLLKYAGPCSTPEEMLERANRYLRRTRALAHEYVNLPEDEDCRCVPVPYRIRESYPWGGYEGGDGQINPIRGQMFLNVYNYQNVTDGWIKINALHEAYPGHHVQYVRSLIDPMPETVKIGAKAVAIMEGMCLRTERAFEFIYGEDPFYPLFVAYRRHHTSVRIKVDLMLFYYGRTIEEAVQTYMEELGFDRTSARGQVLSQEITPGYFTCYYYGMKKICDWEKQYGYSKKDYTELLFSVGNISLDNFERILKMSKEERESYLHDFGSLIERD